MTPLLLAVLGAGAGAGVILTVRALAPRPKPLEAVLRDLARPGRPMADAESPTRTDDRLGGRARSLLSAVGVDVERYRHDLDIVGRTAERHAVEKLAGGVVGLLVPNCLGVAVMSSGIGPPPALVALLSLGTAVGGFLLPDHLLYDEAERRRRAFRHALSSYLDLVVVLLAGGAGIETALHAAADAGDGWGYRTIRRALQRARLTRMSPWAAFADLAEQLDVSELAASVSLAGSHGARIRGSLAAKADTLRGHQVAETEAAAEAATERMTIPVAVLLLGFLLFIAYPAVAQITSVGGPQP